MEITLPHNYKPKPYQLPFLKAWDKGTKRLIIVWHRRSGKDKTCFANLPKKMFEKVAPYFYFAPTYKQGKKIIWDNIDNNGFKFIDHIPKDIIKRKNETEMKIELVNGSFVQIIGTDNIDNIVGSNPFGCIFTEFSIQQKEAWEYIRPILAANGGWAVFIFTPRGTNHAYKLLEYAKTDPKWFWQILTVDDTKAIDQETLDEERRQMPSDLFEQEYYCKFIDGASQFFKGIEKCVYDNPFDDKEENHEYQLGVDIAKVNDETVITPFDLNTFKVGKQERFNQIDYSLQKSRIKAKWYQFNKPVINPDSTGVGDPICDDLSKEIYNLYPYRFTEKSRMDLLYNLQLLIQQQKIKIPNDETLINQLKSFEYVVGNNKLSASCPDNLHDDCVMSLALAVWNIPDRPKQIKHPFDEFREQTINNMSINDKTGYLQ